MQSTPSTSSADGQTHTSLKTMAAMPRACAVLGIALTASTLTAPPASAATLARSVVVQGEPAAVWAMIGPFCAIQEWLPPVGSCRDNGSIPPVRTLVTKDGQATFVEEQTARSDADFYYSYTFKSSPLPVTQYLSTIVVTQKAPGQSTVTWHATYVAQPGKEMEAINALDGIYAAGLESIKVQAIKRFGAVESVHKPS